ncbi:hypothetical protein MJI47_29490, partial [Salmonella enterica subsp. enterica serovar Kentucky]|nr:hypothetical protein [Salmonella enterica subsp. enterica serovar Kentucky]
RKIARELNDIPQQELIGHQLALPRLHQDDEIGMLVRSYNLNHVKQLQKEMFRKSHFPKVSMNPQEANYAYLRGEVELVRLPEA